MTEKNMTKTQVFPWCSLMMCHLDFHVSLRMSAKYRDDIGFLKNGWWKSLWKWGATKLSHALGMPASLKNQELIQKCGEYDGVIVCVCVWQGELSVQLNVLWRQSLGWRHSGQRMKGNKTHTCTPHEIGFIYYLFSFLLKLRMPWMPRGVWIPRPKECPPGTEILKPWHKEF